MYNIYICIYCNKHLSVCALCNAAHDLAPASALFVARSRLLTALPELCHAFVSTRDNCGKINSNSYLIYKDNSGRLNMIGHQRANRALIGCENQWKRVKQLTHVREPIRRPQFKIKHPGGEMGNATCWGTLPSSFKYMNIWIKVQLQPIYTYIYMYMYRGQEQRRTHRYNTKTE